MDEAVFFFGSHVENELNEAEEKPKTKGAKKAARQKVVNKYLTQAKKEKTGFADPAGFFS